MIRRHMYESSSNDTKTDPNEIRRINTQKALLRQLNKFEKQTIDEKAKIVRDNLWIFQEVNPPKKT